MHPARIVGALFVLGCLGGCGAGTATSSPPRSTSGATGMTVRASGIVTAGQGGFLTKATSFLTTIDYGLALRNQSCEACPVRQSPGHSGPPSDVLMVPLLHRSFSRSENPFRTAPILAR
jgi:hypothetical protein